MTKKKYDHDELDVDDPGHPDFPPVEGNAVHEGADAPAQDVIAEPVAAPSQHHTVNELMYEWWKEVRQLTPDPSTIGDHFVTFAAAEGYELVETTPPEKAAEPAHE